MRKALQRVLWAVTIYASLTACALAAVNQYAKLVLPFYRWELGWIAPQYEVENLDLVIAQAQPAFSVTARNSHYLSSVDGDFPRAACFFNFSSLSCRVSRTW